MKLDKPNIPEEWDYKESVSTVKGIVFKAKNLTEDILRELFIARKKLSCSSSEAAKIMHGANAPRTWSIYCEEIGINKSTANRWLQVFEINPHFLSQTPEWNTPDEIVKKVVSILGHIDLDPCSNEESDINATEKFLKREDGLNQSWNGRVYMNPPYGREIGDWINKLCDEYEDGNVIEAIALVPARTDTEWFKRLRIYPRLFVWGRLKFGDSENSAPFPSMIVYMGPNIDGFKNSLKDTGDVYQLVN